METGARGLASVDGVDAREADLDELVRISHRHLGLRQALREHALAGVAAHLHKARDPRVLPVSLASGAK